MTWHNKLAHNVSVNVNTTIKELIFSLSKKNK